MTQAGKRCPRCGGSQMQTWEPKAGEFLCCLACGTEAPLPPEARTKRLRPSFEDEIRSLFGGPQCPAGHYLEVNALPKGGCLACREARAERSYDSRRRQFASGS